MMRTARLGLILTVLVSGVIGLIFGPRAVPPAAGFGVLATAIQIAAIEALRGAAGQPHGVFLKRYAVGMALRLLGVTVMAAAILVRRDLFEALPTAFGFLGVLMPLLFLEARLAR